MMSPWIIDSQSNQCYYQINSSMHVSIWDYIEQSICISRIKWVIMSQIEKQIKYIKFVIIYNN